MGGRRKVPTRKLGPVPQDTVTARPSFGDVTTVVETPAGSPEATVQIQLFSALRVAVVDPAEGERGPVVTALRGLGAPCTVIASAADARDVVSREAFHTVFLMVQGDVAWAAELIGWGHASVPRVHWIPVLREAPLPALKTLRLAGAVEILTPPLPSPMGLVLRAAASAPYNLPAFVTETDEFLRELGTYWRQHEDAVASYRALLREQLGKVIGSRERMRRAVEKMAQKQRSGVDAQLQAIELKSNLADVKKSAMELLSQLAVSQQKLFRAEDEAEQQRGRAEELANSLKEAGRREEELRQQVAEARERERQLQSLASDEGRVQALRRVGERALTIAAALTAVPDDSTRFADELKQLRAALHAALADEPPMVVGRLT